jgi:hypothetical protein
MISHDHIPLSIHIPGSRESQDLATLVLGKLILYTKAPIEDVDRYEILEAAYREKARSDFFADLDEFIEDFKGRR